MLQEMGIVNHQPLPLTAGAQTQGLYDASHEHDACGVGMVVNIHGNKSHELVDNALKVLENMRHRGAEGADGRTGDGAGIMLQIPHEFILLQGIPVPEKGKYGTGVVVLAGAGVRVRGGGRGRVGGSVGAPAGRSAPCAPCRHTRRGGATPRGAPCPT